MLESDEQKKVAKYLRACGALHTCSLAGLSLRMGQIIKATSMGYTKGTPDIMVFERRGVYGALLVEMKRTDKSKSTVSPEQRKWIQEAQRKGYKAVVCYGAEDAIETIEAYLTGDAWL